MSRDVVRSRSAADEPGASAARPAPARSASDPLPAGVASGGADASDRRAAAGWPDQDAATGEARTVNIATHLTRVAARHPDRIAVIAAAGRDPVGRCAWRSWTFAQLERESNRLAGGLRRLGMGRGTRTVLMVRPSLDFVALVFALFKVGAVPVVIDPGLGRRRMVDGLARVEAEAFVGIPAAQILRLLHRGAFRSVRHVVTVGRRWAWSGASLDDLRRGSPDHFTPAPTGGDEMAAILFTSGSTGPPRGVVYEHRTFEAQLRLLRETYRFGDDEVDLATFPLFALFDPALGLTCVLPEMDFSRPASADPRRIIEAIRAHGVTSMFASPALLDRVARCALTDGVRLTTLRRAISAGAPVRPEVIERMHRAMRAADAPGPSPDRSATPDGPQVFTPYGATEALPVSSIGSFEILGQTREATARGAGVCVGRPVAGVTVRIIPIVDGPIERWSDASTLPVGRIGEIVVRGPVVTRGYWRDPDATRGARIPADDADVTDAAAADDAAWHRMGDVGYLDAEGRLWMCGRKSQRVTTRQGTLFTIPCEAVFNQHPAVRRSALVGVPEGGLSARRRSPDADAPGQDGDAPAHDADQRPVQRPVLCVELEPAERRIGRRRLRRELLALGAGHAHTRDIQTILVHPRFPVDVRHNAKIFREQLADWAARRLR